MPFSPQSMLPPPIGYYSSARRKSAQVIFTCALLRCEMGIQVIQGDVTARGFYLDFFLSGTLPVDFHDRLEEMYRSLARTGQTIHRVERLRQNAVDWCKWKGQHFRARLLQANASDTLSFAAFDQHLEPCPGPVAPQVGSAELILGEVLPALLPIGKYRQPVSRIQVVLAFDRKAAHRFRKSLKNFQKGGLSHVDQGSFQKLFARVSVASTPVWVWHQRGQSSFSKLTAWWRALQSDRDVEILDACEFHLGASPDPWQQSPETASARAGTASTRAETASTRVEIAPAGIFAQTAALLAGQNFRKVKDGVFSVAALETLREPLQLGQQEGLLSKENFTGDSTWVFCAKEQLLVRLRSILQLIETVISIAGFKGIWSYSLKGANGKFKTQQAEATVLLKRALESATLPCALDDGDLVNRWPSATAHVQCELGQWWPLGFVQFDCHQSDIFEPKGNKQPNLALCYSIVGSFERFFALILERGKGTLPLWLAPEQVRLIATSDEVLEANFRAQVLLQEKGVTAKVERATCEIGQIPAEREALGALYLAISDPSKGPGNWLRVWQFGTGSWQVVNAREFAESLSQEIASQIKRWSLKERI